MTDGGQHRLQQGLRIRPRPRQQQPNRWSMAADLLVRGLIAVLVVLVMVQTFHLGRPLLEVDLYGRVLEDWGYAPALGSSGVQRSDPLRHSLTPASPAAATEELSGAQAVPLAAGGSVRALISLAYEGMAPLYVRLNGVPLDPVAPGRTLPLALRPGDQVAFWVPEGAGRVRVLYASPALAAPRPGQIWPVASQPQEMEFRWKAP